MSVLGTVYNSNTTVFFVLLLQALLDAATQAPAWPKTETNNMTESCVGRKGGLKQCLVTVECVFQCLCSMFVFNVCVQCLCFNVCVQCLCSMLVSMLVSMHVQSLLTTC